MFCRSKFIYFSILNAFIRIHDFVFLRVSLHKQNYPASNLISGLDKKWKCEETGLDTAYVVLEFEAPTKISGIDIGNEHSAFIDVAVGRNGWPLEKYKVSCIFLYEIQVITVWFIYF